MRFSPMLSIFSLVAVVACVKPPSSGGVPQTFPSSVPESQVSLPQTPYEEIGVSEEQLKRVYENENLKNAANQLAPGKKFEINVLLTEDWRERLPLRVRGGESRKHGELSARDVVTGIGQLLISSFVSNTPAADSLRRMNESGELQTRPFDLMKVELKSSSFLELIAALNTLHRTPGVIFAEPNFRVRKIATPNDPSFPSLWGMSKIKAPETWSSYTGGQDVVVAVIDTGIDIRHDDLKDNIWVNTRETAGNGVDDDGNGYIDDVNGWDFAYSDNNPSDGDSHGTHCAGTVAARGNNGVGVAGVNWRAKLMPVKVLDDSGGGYNYDIYNGILYAVSNGAKVTSNSYGGGGASSLMATAIRTAQDRGVLFVAAAGNESASSASYPAYYTKTYNNVISVASTDSNDALSSFSNYGNGVDVAAPGRNILSTTPNNNYSTFSGTSMATPHVAGMATLLWGAAPSKTMSQIRSAILSSSDVLPSLNGKVANSGRVNLKAAYDVVTSDSPTPSPTSTPTVGPSPTPTPTSTPTVEPSPTPSPSPTATPTPVPTQPPPQPAYKDGLKWRVYHGFWLKLPKFDALRPVATGTALELTLNGAGRKGQYGMVHEGLLWIPVSGRYTFYLKSDDGSALFIDGDRVVNNDGLHGPVERSGERELAAGFHTIRVDYFQLFGGESLGLQWAGPSLSKRKLSGKGIVYHQ
jgi:subtilisin family serine protease